MINLTVHKDGACTANKDFYSEVACANYLKLFLGMTNVQGYDLFDELEEFGHATFSKSGYLAILTIRP